MSMSMEKKSGTVLHRQTVLGFGKYTTLGNAKNGPFLASCLVFWPVVGSNAQRTITGLRRGGAVDTTELDHARVDVL
jgi:hypothetical protein